MHLGASLCRVDKWQRLLCICGLNSSLSSSIYRDCDLITQLLVYDPGTTIDLRLSLPHLFLVYFRSEKLVIILFYRILMHFQAPWRCVWAHVRPMPGPGSHYEKSASIELRKVTLELNKSRQVLPCELTKLVNAPAFTSNWKTASVARGLLICMAK